MKGWFDTLPGDLIDAGRMDGASEWRAFAAGSIVSSAPILALFYALQKHLLGGLTAGSVK
jgi:ABC-type maltose transport system permease subunit